MTCCAPSCDHGDDQHDHQSSESAAGGAPSTTMVALRGGPFDMGSAGSEAYPADGEAPVHTVELAPFSIDTVAVSIARFAEFVETTGFVTEAEHFGWSFVFGGFLPDDFPDTCGVPVVQQQNQ